MRQKQKYPPIIPQTKDWPVVRLNRQHKAFVQAVIDESAQALLATHPAARTLHSMLVKTAALELARVQRKAWKVDCYEATVFWEQVSDSLASQRPDALPILLRKIIKRYAQEITGRFRIAHYRLGQRAVTYALDRLLNPVGLRGVRIPWQRRTRLQEKIHILGAISQLRELTRIGTIVMVPTHSSHLDSILLAWMTYTLGLPHFIYGAGLNLFNSKFFAYFMNNLGTYKIDRRRKNLPYLTTLKTYSTLALQQGCHSLFYPGGARSRSGALEQQLKLGLLGTAFEAQWRNYQRQGPAARKLFVVPVVLSYHCVLEAPSLIQGYLAAHGQLGLDHRRAPYFFSQRLLKLVDNFFSKDSSIFVSIGEAMDLLGNKVDESGSSYDAQGVPVDMYQSFLESAAGRERCQEEAQTRALGHAIVKAYYKTNCVLTSHLLAFAAFVLIKQQHIGLSLKALLQLPPEQLVIPYIKLEATFARCLATILRLHSADKVQVEPDLQGTNVAAMVRQGLRNLGLYHTQRPLLQNQAGDITTQDLCTLWYYHNRLQGYDLDKELS